MAGRTRRASAIVAALVVIGAACSSGGADGVQSRTPRIHAEVGDPSRLLQPEDLRVMPGLAPARVSSIDDTPYFENPDPRGPCGAVVPDVPMSGTTGRTYQGSTVVAIEILVPESPAARAWFEAQLADLSDDCPGFDSTTNTGSTQHVLGAHAVDVSDLSLDALAFTTAVRTGPGGVNAGFAVVQAGNVWITLQVLSRDPVRVSGLHDLAAAAVARAHVVS